MPTCQHTECIPSVSHLLAQDGLVIDEEGHSPVFDKLRVMFRDSHLVGNLVSKWDLQALDPLQFKAIIILTDNSDAASGGDLDGVQASMKYRRRIRYE